MNTRLKGRLPWRIGATSYVVPGDVMTNVHLLADRIDDIQILFFESPAMSGLSHDIPVVSLREIARDHDLSYTVHLPTDVRLGSGDRTQRREAVAVILRLIERLDALAPECFDLHLLREGKDEELWLDHLQRSLAEISASRGKETAKIAIENIEYPFDRVRKLALESGFSLCLDIGHALRYGHDLEAMFTFLDKTRHIHLHGTVDGKDHLAVTNDRGGVLSALGEKLVRAGYSGAVTVEVFDEKSLDASLAVLGEVWEKNIKGV